METVTPLRDFWRSLRVAPPPLTPRERLLVIAMTIASALLRLLTYARSPWDWDEMLFVLGMRHYNVAQHHPHPPGFPLWIAAAKLLHLLGLSEFRALQALTLLGSMAVVPATFFLCRELRMRFATALGASAILAFFPNVWFYGETGLSDVPSMTLVILAAALLLRGCRDRRAYLAGAIVLAIAAGVRPQNLLIGFAPALIASAFRRWRDVIVAALLGALIVGASYGTAAVLTGVPSYREALAAHSDYIAKVDSFRNPGRPPLSHIFIDFFVRPYRMRAVNIAVALFAAISVVAGAAKRRPHVVIMLAAFGPFCLFAWLMLDFYSASRFSIGYAPLIAVLAADGVALIARYATAEAIVDALLVLVMIGWSWPALRFVHGHVSPPVEALQWIRANVDPRTTQLYVHGSLGPYAEVYLNGYPYSSLEPSDAPRLLARPTLLATEGGSNLVGARNFNWPHKRLWWIARQRYFEVSAAPMTEMVSFVDGWYDEESSGGEVWRWMGARGTARLPPLYTRRARLTLSFFVPLDILPAPPNVTISVNGVVVARARATASELHIDQTVDARGDRPNELVIETDQAVRPASDARTLGLKLGAIGWLPL